MDLILASLPWVLLCPAVCIWVLKWPRLHKAGARLASGLALGPMLGVVLNGMHLWPSNMPGFAIGVLWGAFVTGLVKPHKSIAAATC